MATYYVGPGGSDASNGLSWANRKLTLNGAEDIPVAANDTVYVGPGVYREVLTCDVSGSAGNPITYIADNTGENTDTIGGKVRITGSDNDQTITRSNCITASSRTYRTFRGFEYGECTGDCISITAGTNWIVEDSFFNNTSGANNGAVYSAGAGQSNLTVRRCVFWMGGVAQRAIYLTHSSTVDNCSHLIENCIFVSSNDGRTFETTRVGGVTIKNCAFYGSGRAVRVFVALTAAQTITVNNSIFSGCGFGVQATTTGEIIEDYNTFVNTTTARNNVSTGSNSVTYPPIVRLTSILKSGYRIFPIDLGLSQWSQIRALTGTGMPTDDFYGLTRPTTAGKRSWGPVQFFETTRETTTTRTGGVSMKLADAGRHQMFVPVTNTSTTISVYTYRETNYAGTNPQMIIRQPGQADRTTTDAGSATTWNQLTDTFTPAANPPYVVVTLASNNTATSGSYAAFFDDLSVS